MSSQSSKPVTPVAVTSQAAAAFLGNSPQVACYLPLCSPLPLHPLPLTAIAAEVPAGRPFSTIQRVNANDAHYLFSI